MSGTNLNVVLALLGGAATILGFMFTTSGGPTPGGTYVTGYGEALAAYFSGSIGGALLAGSVRKIRIRQKRIPTESLAGPLTGISPGGVVLAFLGGVVMMLGFMFTIPCLGTLTTPNAASCGLGIQWVQATYLFGTMGGALLVGGAWKIGTRQRGIPAEGISPRR